MGRVDLTTSEWYVLDSLWDRAPQTVMELVSALGERVGWAKSTTITTLRRMEAKGLVRSQAQGRGKLYFPQADRRDCVRAETRSFLDRVYRGSVGLMVSAMASERALSQAEIDELYAILRRAEEDRT